MRLSLRPALLLSHRVSAAPVLIVMALLSGCAPMDHAPTATRPSADVVAAASGTAELSMTAGATVVQTGDVGWTLDKSGSLSGTTVTWNITATQITTVSGQLLIQGQVTLTNTGTGPAPIGNVVVNLQKRVNKQWVTQSSDVANATAGDAATTASIHPAASSEDLGTFSENGASGALSFTNATDNSAFSLVPQQQIGAGQTLTLLFSAAFDNTDAALQLPSGTPIRSEVIVTFGNATVNGKSTPNLDINGSGAIDPEEAHVRSAQSRLALTVPAPIDGSAPVTLTDALADITTTGTVTFTTAQFTLGATSGTVSATVNGGASGGTITNCAHLTSTGQSGTSGVDLQACSTVNVAASPPNCTPGAQGCGWSNGDMHTFAQISWGDPTSAAGSLLTANYTNVYGGNLVIGGTFFAVFTSASAVFAYLPALGTASSLTASVQNPVTTASGELGGEILALQLNVDFSAASLLTSAVDLGSLRFCNFTDLPVLNSQTVDQFLATANNLLGGGGAPFGASVAAAVAHDINAAFVGGAPSTFAQANLVAGSSCGWAQGDMHTATQGGWDSGGAATLLAANFSSLYPGGLTIGSGFTATFTNASAVFAYLPALGTPSMLNGNLTNPLTTSAGELGGQVLALTLNTDFSTMFGNDVPFGDVRICNFAAIPVVNGMTIDEFLTTAHWILGGGSASFGPSTALTVANLLNSAFVDGAPSTFAQNNLVAGNCPAP